MQETATKPASVAVELKDARLFREACYVDGQWIQSKSGAAINVDNPATGEIIGRVPKLGGAETKQAIEAANRAFPALLVATAGTFSAGVIREKRLPHNHMRMFLKDGVAVGQWIDNYARGRGWRRSAT